MPVTARELEKPGNLRVIPMTKGETMTSIGKSTGLQSDVFATSPSTRARATSYGDGLSASSVTRPH